MKKIQVTLVLLFAMAFANGQIVNIPDVNFKAKLLSANSSNSIAFFVTTKYNKYFTTSHTKQKLGKNYTKTFICPLPHEEKSV